MRPLLVTLILLVVLASVATGAVTVPSSYVHASVPVTPLQMAVQHDQGESLAAIYGESQLLTSISAVATGGSHTCALTMGGSVKCWGRNGYGRLGDGTTTDRWTPVDVNGLGDGMQAIDLGSSHTCALTASGSVKCWGRNESGQLGDGTLIDRWTPMDVSGLGSWVNSIGVGGEHTCALTAGGGVKCWGHNGYGQLGTTSWHWTPVDVNGLGSGVQAIAAGVFHTCALTTIGGVKCWGRNDAYQLGDGTDTDRWMPVNVTGLSSGVQAITAGYDHTCALTTSGGVKCWGGNEFGQLGDGTNALVRLTPVEVSGLSSGVKAISAGWYYHTCALTTGNGVKCWGGNESGELGDGTNTRRLTPVDVNGLSSGAQAITAGQHHTCALTMIGGVKCWGENESGKLGDGTDTDRWTPVNVSGLFGATPTPTPTATPTATPTFTPTRTPTPTPVSIVRFEVNQALGKQFNFAIGEQVDAYNFVARKNTAVRIFLSGPIIPDVVRPQLTIRRDGVAVRNWTLTGNQPTSILNFVCIDLASCGNWQAGTYTFDVNVGGVTEQKTGVKFEERRLLRILAVPLKIRVDGEIKSMEGNDWKTVWEFMSETYPVARGTDGVQWRIGAEVDVSAFQWDEGAATNLAPLLSFSNFLICSQRPLSAYCNDVIVGFWPSGPIQVTDTMTTTPKYASGINVANTALVCTIGPDCNPIPPTVAHEVGHIFGLGDEYDDAKALVKCEVNPPPGRQFTHCDDDDYEAIDSWKTDSECGSATVANAYGFDVNDLTSVVDKLSFMGCKSKQATATSDHWVTPRIYSHLFDQLAPRWFMAADTDLSELLVVSGWIGRDDTISLDPAYRIQTAAIDIPADTGDYMIEAVDASGNVLSSQRFDVSFVVLTNPPSEIDPAPFVAMVPAVWHGPISFRIKHGSDVIGQRLVSANAPIINITTPTAGQNVTGLTTITWQSSDVDGDTIYHIVEYSRDGQDWTVLASNIETTQLAVDFGQLAGSTGAYIRVTANDGLNTTHATSEAFSVPAKGPEAFILSPENGATISNANDIVLSGNAYDLEDGWLQSIATFSWRSDRDGNLGTGAQKAVSLSTGLHMITLNVADSNGNIAETSIQVNIGATIYLPLTVR